ncbi:MAG: TonB-dependent siderophore receptor [Leptolyngbya sp. SIO4C1]|nr:TonB-dependent siderophore receptor [Leptolyngbya sp. SIO4C1]
MRFLCTAPVWRLSNAIAPSFLSLSIALYLNPQIAQAQSLPAEPAAPDSPPSLSIEQVFPAAASAPAQIIDVIVSEIADGLQLVLVTADPTLPEVFQSQAENTLRLDLTNAELALPSGAGYQQLNPVPSVALVTLEQREDEVRITVVGTDATAPSAYLERTSEALRLDVVTVPPDTTSGDLSFESGNLRIIVAAAPLSSYRVPTASAGTRTDTDILDVPQGIQVIPEAVIEDQSAGSLGDTLRNVSGVSAGRTSAGGRATTPIVRGFETSNILRNGLRDDTLRLSSGLSNIEQIEILKGPASVLFGAGNLGGTINLITEVPLREPRYEFDIAVGNNALYRSTLDLTGPFDTASHTMGYRLNLAYEAQNSFRDFVDSEFFFTAPSLRLIDTDRSSLIVDLEYVSNVTRGTAPGLPAASAIGLEDNTFIEEILDGGAELSAEALETAGTLDIRANLGEPDISRTETSVTRLGYRLQHNLSDRWRLNNEFLASFQTTPRDSAVVGVGFVQERGQPDITQLDRIYIDNPSDRTAYTLNTNVIGDFEVLGIDQTLLLGLEWSQTETRDKILQRLFLPFLSDAEPFDIFDPNYDASRFFSDIPGFGGVDLNERVGSDSFTRVSTVGLYGQTQLDFGDSIILLLGGRLDFADQSFQDLANRADPSPISVFDTAFSPRVGLVIKPSEDISLYASYTESFNPVIGRSETGEVFSPERGNQFEAGIKANLFNDRLSATLAYYRLRRSNVLTQDPANPGFQIQLGEQASDGVEFDLAGEILPGWNIIASYAYTDARVLEDREFPEGLRLLNVPEHAASLWTSYEIQSGDLAGLGLGVGVYFQDERNGDIRNPFVLPAYTRTDAALFYRRENFSAQLNFQNLFDIRYFEGARDQFRVNPGAPFSIVGSLNWEF